MVEVRLYRPIDKQKVFSGRLVGLRDGFVVIETGGSQRSFELKSVAKAAPLIEYEDVDYEDILKDRNAPSSMNTEEGDRL